MPSRDYDPSHDEQRPEGRWSGEPGRRDAERRYGRQFGGFEGRDPRERETEADGAPEAPPSGTFTNQDTMGRGGSAFMSASREQRMAGGQAGPGSSYGGASGGRASGSQAYGYEPSQGDPGRPRGGMDSSEFSQSVYDRSDARRRAGGGDWDHMAQDPRRGPPGQALRGRAWQHGGESGPEPTPQPRFGAERHDENQFDPDYRQWREEQMRMLDREYAQWRQERYRKFAEEFSQWRSQRLAAGGLGQRPERKDQPSEGPPPLGSTSALGPTAAGPLKADEREHEPERERSGGGLLSSLLGGHGDRNKSHPEGGR